MRGPRDVVRRPVAVRPVPAERPVRQRGVLGDHVDDVHAEAVDAAVEPPAHHRVDGLPHLRVLPVEVGLLAGEQVEEVLPRGLVELPRGAGEERAPVRGLRPRLTGPVAGAGRTPPVPVPLGTRRRRPRLDEPRVLVRGVVDDEVHDQLHAALVESREQPVQVVQAAEQRVDGLVVADVVAVVVLGRRVDRGEPQHVDAQGHEVVEVGGDAVEVTDAVPVGVGEAARIDLVDHRRLPPGGAVVDRAPDGLALPASCQQCAPRRAGHTCPDARRRVRVPRRGTM